MNCCTSDWSGTGGASAEGDRSWDDRHDAWVLRYIGSADTGEIRQSSLDFGLGSSPGLYTGNDLLSEIIRWAVAADIAVGAALGK